MLKSTKNYEYLELECFVYIDPNCEIRRIDQGFEGVYFKVNTITGKVHANPIHELCTQIDEFITTTNLNARKLKEARKEAYFTIEKQIEADIELYSAITNQISNNPSFQFNQFILTGLGQDMAILRSIQG